MSKQFSNTEIANYYDFTRSHYSLFWRLDECRSLHYGYWDDSTRSFSEALMHINAVMAKAAEIGDGMNILDAGCGEGGSVAWLATHFASEVIGITLSEKQMLNGNAFLKSKGLSNARMEVQDFTATNFPSNTFDVVWAIESVSHAEEKQKFLNEMFRILKPGGKIILADFFAVKEMQGEDLHAMQSWAHAWAVPAFEEKNTFLQKAKLAGFDSIEAKDISTHVERSVKRLYRMFYFGWLGSKVYNLFHPKTSAAGKANVYSAYWQYVAFKKGLWKYQLIKLGKGTHN
jgi:tocopherol O-methyltransferase